MKKDPRFQNSLASVNKIANDTISNLGGTKERSGSRESLTSDAVASSAATGLSNSAAVVDLSGHDKYFSLGDDDESLMTPPQQHASPVRKAPADAGPEQQQQQQQHADDMGAGAAGGAEGFQSVELGRFFMLLQNFIRRFHLTSFGCRCHQPSSAQFDPLCGRRNAASQGEEGIFRFDGGRVTLPYL